MQTEEKIINFIKKNPEYSITDICKNSNINRMTLSKYLAILEAKGKVGYKNKGMKKLFYLK